jgi:hypothetical protein
MGRPQDWSPLADADPAPGNPGNISLEASHLSSVAREITAQVGRLRAIGSDGTLTGQYADVLRSGARDLAGQLDKVTGRYEKTATALTSWVPELEGYQRQSLVLLGDAQDAQRRQRANQPPTTGQETAAETKARQGKLDQASSDLQTIKNQLGTMLGNLDDDAKRCADTILNAIQDGVADSWWDGFKAWVDRNARWLSDLATILEVIGTIVAVIALICTGVGLLLLIGAAVTALALLVRTALAATGNGSWLDVGLDAFALLTFGTGRIFGSALKASVEGGEDIARGMITAERGSMLSGKIGSTLLKGASFLKDGVATKLGDLGLNTLGNLTERLGSTVADMGTRLLERAYPSLAQVVKDSTVAERFLNGGEEEGVTLACRLTVLRGVVGDLAHVDGAGDLAAKIAQGTRQLNIVRGSFIMGGAADLQDKIQGGLDLNQESIQIPGIGTVPVVPDVHLHVPGTGYYRDFKDSATTEGGLTAGQFAQVQNVVGAVPVAGSYFRMVTSPW